MTRAAAVLAYLASLAPAGPTPGLPVVVSRRGDIAPVDRYLPTAEPQQGPWFPVAASESLRRLAALDGLHAGEQLLRYGWLWLTGESEAGRVMTPLLEAPARLSSGMPRRLLLSLVDDVDLAPGLPLDPDARDRLSAEVEEIAVRFPAEAATTLGLFQRLGTVGDWIDRVGAACGLHISGVEPATTDLWSLREGPGVRLWLGAGVYLARDIDRPGVADALRSWAALAPAGTALDVMYGEPGPVDGGADPAPITTPLPLNRAQRDVLQSARRSPLTVVAGPPGTGKSHLVAALAVDEVARGNAVLVATQTDHAARVVAGLLERHPGPRFVRFGSREDRRRVAAQLADGLAVPFDDDEADRIRRSAADAAAQTGEVRERIAHLLRREAAFTGGLAGRATLGWAAAGCPRALDPAQRLDRLEALLRRGSDAGGLAGRWRQRRARSTLRRHLGADPSVAWPDLVAAVRLARAEADVRSGLAGGGLSLTAHWDELVRLERQRRDAAGRAVELVRRRRRNRRGRSTRAVAALATALRAGRATRRRMLRDLPSGAFLDVLPLWVGTLAEIDDTLPVEPGAFDVVIFDEASQIDQIRAAPALARARRAVVVGDPRQLRHVSFVADAAMSGAGEEAGLDPELVPVLDVRRNSLFDAAAAGAPVVRLEEHFRSVPHIIGFSSRRFYDGGLKLMTQHPSTETVDAIRIVVLPGDLDAGGTVPAEIDAVRSEVAALLGTGVSIGVVTPFRAQADAIEEMLLDTFHPDELFRGGVRAGTVHSFQGAERDVVIISTALGAHPGSRRLRFLEDPNLFNVMVTRARQRVIVILTAAPDELPGGVLRDYLRHADRPPLPSDRPGAVSGWLGELAAALAGFGLPVVPDYPVAGWTVDLAVGAGAAAVGVIAGVHPGGVELHIERQLALHRAGWRLIDAFQSRWLADPDGAVGGIVEEVLRRSP